MIILRQKQYATGVERAMVAMNKIPKQPKTIEIPKRKGVRAIYTYNKTKNKLNTLPARVMRGYYENKGDLEKRAIADLRVKEGTKSKRQMMRDAIETSNKTKAGILEALNASTSKGGTVKYIGNKTGDLVQAAADNPATVATGIVGYGTLPFGIMMPPGMTEAVATREKGWKKNSKVYRNITKRTGNFAKKHKAKERTSQAVQSILASIV